MSYQPPQYPQRPPDQYPPPGFPPGQYPPDQGLPPGQPVQRRRGCRGCVFGCLIACGVGVVLVIIALAAGVYAVRQMYPTTESVQQAAGCAVIRLFAESLESTLAESEMSEDEKAGMRRELEQLRREFEGQCGPLQ